MEHFFKTVFAYHLEFAHVRCSYCEFCNLIGQTNLLKSRQVYWVPIGKRVLLCCLNCNRNGGRYVIITSQNQSGLPNLSCMHGKAWVQGYIMCTVAWWGNEIHKFSGWLHFTLGLGVVGDSPSHTLPLCGWLCLHSSTKTITLSYWTILFKCSHPVGPSLSAFIKHFNYVSIFGRPPIGLRTPVHILHVWSWRWVQNCLCTIPSTQQAGLWQLLFCVIYKYNLNCS